VRRSVAAREAGQSDILAVIAEPGHPDVLTRIPLTQLHSPKPSILRDGRYVRVELATCAGKPMDPIEVQPMGLPGQLPTTPLLKVPLL
jgi:hypothetical protein